MSSGFLPSFDQTEVVRVFAEVVVFFFSLWGFGNCRTLAATAGGLKMARVQGLFLDDHAAAVMCVMMAFALASSGEAATAAVSSEKSLATSSSDAYEKIETYGFPRGILPPTVTGYNLEANGRFVLYLEGDCRVLIEEKYPLEYGKVITGVLSYGQLEELQGIRVKAFFVWWDITAISRNSNDLLFVIGLLSAQFPLTNFDDPPVCERKKLDVLLLAGGGGVSGTIW